MYGDTEDPEVRVSIAANKGVRMSVPEVDLQDSGMYLLCEPVYNIDQVP